ncbi:MAG TPA: ATP-binding protein [Kiritimatiellia bacterium]|nr:ATP-binding protein [Kiritimatiellia bacterium]HMP00402.1 ATP-binding protein [Kiritimatiellia bacterium]
MPIFEYTTEESIGSVYSVDTGTVLVSVSNLDALRKLQVNHLVVLRSSRAGQHLIGLINKIMRKALVGVNENEAGEVQDDRSLVENIVRVSLIGTLLDAVGTDQNVFRRTLETVPEIDAPCFVLNGEKLTGFMRAISKQIVEGQEPLSLGKYTLDEEANAWIDGNRFFQRHAVVVGSTGSGKSWTVARILEQVAELPNASALLFDIHGEYAPLTGDGISHLRVAGPGDLDGARTLDDGIIFLPYWLLTYEEMLAMLLDRTDQNAPNQAMVFNREVLEAKKSYLEGVGKDAVLANFTIDSPVPYALGGVVDKLQELDSEMVAGARSEKQGPFHGKLTRFVQRLQSKIGDRRLGFLFNAGEDAMRYEWLEELATVLLGSTTVREKGGVKIIDFSEVPSDILPLVIGLVARIVFSVQQWTEKDLRHPVALLCDEAHLYIPERHETGISEAGLRSFERIAKEGRKYGVGLTVISQRPAEVNRTVLSQCSNFVAMRLTNAEDQAVIRRLLPDTLGGFADLLPILDIGEALVVGDAAMLPSRIRIDEPNNRPSSATVAFWDRWAADVVENGIPAAVESLRKQRTGD